MHQPRTNPDKAVSRRRRSRRPHNPEIDTAPSSSPLDALVRGLVSIGEKLFRGRAQLRNP